MIGRESVETSNRSEFLCGRDYPSVDENAKVQMRPDRGPEETENFKKSWPLVTRRPRDFLSFEFSIVLGRSL